MCDVFKRKLRVGEISADEMRVKKDELLGIWQERYVSQDKGDWTKRMIPSVVERYFLPLEMDHYTSQLLTRHGNFRRKLHSFKLVPAPTCECILGGSETVAHMLLK